MYATKYTVLILSEDPIPEDMDFDTVLAEASTGSFVADIRDDSARKLTDDEMRAALTEAGSDPSFFHLD